MMMRTEPESGAHSICFFDLACSLALTCVVLAYLQGTPGYDEMLDLQSQLWPKGTPSSPRCWDSSDGLTNSMHVDRDATRSSAVTSVVCAKGSDKVVRGWFLVPTAWCCHPAPPLSFPPVGWKGALALQHLTYARSALPFCCAPS